MTTAAVVKMKDEVMIDAVFLPRNCYEVLESLARLMGQTPQEYIAQALQHDLEMALAAIRARRAQA